MGEGDLPHNPEPMTARLTSKNHTIEVGVTEMRTDEGALKGYRVLLKLDNMAFTVGDMDDEARAKAKANDLIDKLAVILMDCLRD